MALRQALSSSAYSYHSKTAETADEAVYAAESSIALLAKDSDKLNDQFPGFYLDRSNHTGSIEFNDLSLEMQNILSSGSKTAAGLSKNIIQGSASWHDIYNGNFQLLIDKNVTVNFSMETELASGYYATAKFQVYINGELRAERQINVNDSVSLSASKDCKVGEVTVRVCVLTWNNLLKNGCVNINW